MITFQEESLKNVFEEASDLMVSHWEELANHKEDRPLNPDFDTYIKLNEAGTIRLFTVRDDGYLIGYATFLIANNLHYKDWKYASCDIYYLDKMYRKKGIGGLMLNELQKWLKSLDVKSVIIHEKADHPHSEMFQALGFNLIERYYEKVL